MPIAEPSEFAAMLIRKDGKKEITEIYEKLVNGNTGMDFYEFEEHIDGSDQLVLLDNGYVDVDDG